MNRLNFSVDINAPREKVWNALWDDASYRKWTSVFSEGSYAVSDWEEGSKILFMSENGDGMNSIIHQKIPLELMSFKHMGTLKKGEEVPADKDAEAWIGALETYRLEETNGTTHLSVELDITDSMRDYFTNTFPNALAQVKKLAEAGE